MAPLTWEEVIDNKMINSCEALVDENDHIFGVIIKDVFVKEDYVHLELSWAEKYSRSSWRAFPVPAKKCVVVKKVCSITFSEDTGKITINNFEVGEIVVEPKGKVLNKPTDVTRPPRNM